MKIRNALRSYGVISTMLLCMIGFILLHLGHRDLAFSEKENRVLQQRPAADMAAVFHGSFQKESQAWLRDQFDQRFALVQLHANLNYILLKESRGCYYWPGLLFCFKSRKNQIKNGFRPKQGSCGHSQSGMGIRSCPCCLSPISRQSGKRSCQCTSRGRTSWKRAKDF